MRRIHAPFPDVSLTPSKVRYNSFESRTMYLPSRTLKAGLARRKVPEPVVISMNSGSSLEGGGGGECMKIGQVVYAGEGQEELQGHVRSDV